jgi:hypothetical protein
MKESSITIVLGYRSDSRHGSTIIDFSYCCLQSSQIWRRCQKFSFEVFLVDSRMDTCRGVSTSWWGIYLVLLVSSRALYLWLLNCVGITLKLPWTPLNHMVNSPAPFTPLKGTWGCHPFSSAPLGQSWPGYTHPCLFWTVTPPCPDMARPCFKDTCHNPSKLSHDASSIGVKLSCVIVLTSW